MCAKAVFLSVFFVFTIFSNAFAVDCAAGKYWNGSSCVTCLRGYYCAGFTNVAEPVDGQGLTECPPDYTDGDPGASNKSQCMITTPPGYYTVGYGLLVCFELGYNCLGDIRVRWGSAGGYALCPVKEYSDVSGAVACKMCPEGYQKNGATGKKSIYACQGSVPGGTYIANPFDTVGTICPAGSYCNGTLVNYGGTGGITQCPTGYTDGAEGVSVQNSCQMKLPEGYYIKTSKDSVPTKCTEPGYACPGTMISYGGVGGQTICSGATYSGIPGASSCSACPVGYTANAVAGKGLATDCQMNVTAGRYLATAGSTALTVCPEGTYCPSGVVNYGSTSTPIACPVGYTDGDAGIDTINKCTLKKASGKYVVGVDSPVITDCPAGSYCPEAAIIYGNPDSTTPCPGDYNDGGTGLSSNTECKIQTSGGKYIASSQDLTETDCPAGYYCPSELIVYGGISTPLSCTGATYSNAGAAACTPCPTGYDANTDPGKTDASQCQFQTSDGYYIQNPGDSTQTACDNPEDCSAALVNYGHTNGITQCTGESYFSNDECILCPTGYRDDTSINKTSQSQCKKKLAPGYYIKTATSATEVICPGTSYCPGEMIAYGSVGGLAACPTGYVNGDAGAAQLSDCKKTATAGYYLPIAESNTLVKCPAGYYCERETINYGSTVFPKLCPTGKYSGLGSSVCANCPVGYESGSAVKVSINDCQIQLEPGFYIATSRSSEPTACLIGSYCPGALISYNSTGGHLLCTAATYSDTIGASECKACPTGYNANVTAGKTSSAQCQVSVDAGKYIKNSGDTVGVSCPAGSYCAGGFVNYGETGVIKVCAGASFSGGGAAACEACPTGYSINIEPGKTSINQCQIYVSATKYIGTKNSITQSNCPAGSHCPDFGPLNYGSVNTPIKCTGATFSLGSALECEACATGYDDDLTEGKTSYSGCKIRTTPGEYIQFNRDSAPSICPKGKYCPSTMVAFASSNAPTGCPSGYGDGDEGAGAITDCKRLTTPGTYIATSKSGSLVNCGVGHYCPSSLVNYESIGERYACPAGTVTRGLGLGADEPGDCGHVLRIGANKLYLRSDKKTTPSLNVVYDGVTYYGNASTEPKSRIKVKADDVTYSIYDDGM